MTTKKPDPRTPSTVQVPTVADRIGGLEVLAPFPLFAAAPLSREVVGGCGDTRIVGSSNKPAARVSVSASNRGDCVLVIELQAGNVTKGKVEIPVGESGSIASAGVEQVDIGCLASSHPKARCRFSYTIVWSS